MNLPNKLTGEMQMTVELKKNVSDSTTQIKHGP